MTRLRIAHCPRAIRRNSIWPILIFLAVSAVSSAAADDRAAAFFTAARKGNAEGVAKLLADGVDVNSKTAYGATALHFPADKGHVEVVKLLLAHKADPKRIARPMARP